ncbi:tape measure protein [Moraxella nasibovis]|uniref:tape measure protein n=1 Tax=Moraxella nasibovis TaxID=2904120 RepID=UPI0024109799|nr:tape measure protein [Moraxella nasibovis]WFF39297.1 tape measure protein [Moraxella nasibovis]
MSAVERRVEIVVGAASAEQRIKALVKQFASLKGASNNASDAIDDLAKSATNLGTSIDKNGRLRDANGRFVKMGQDAKQASQGVDKLAQSTRKLGDSADYTNKLLGGLKGMMAGYFSLAGLGSVLKTADAMQTQNAQIKQVTESTEQYIAVKKQLFQIAQSTHQDIEATTTAYTNNARSLQHLGKNQAEILKFTESVSLAMAVGGKSAQEQASALVQLGQAMQSGVLQGDEFRSIAENAPILLDLVAQSLNKTRAEVKELASDGKISAEVIYNAMAGASEELKAKYAAMPVTMNQALTTVQNQYKRLVDEFMNGTGGLSEKIASAILWVNEHFNSIIPTLAGLTAIYGSYLVMNSAFVASIPAKVAGLAASTTAFYQESVAMNANAAAKARAVMANVTLTNAASAMAIGVSRAGIAVMNAARFIDRKTASVMNASRSLATYSANLVRTNGVLGATRLAVAGTTTALVAQARAVATSNAAKVALTATTRTMAGVMTTAGRAIASVGAIIKAHPIMILAGIITTVITATMGLEEAMKSFGDAVTIVGYGIQDFVKWSVDGFTNKMGKAIDWMSKFFSKSSQDGSNKASAAFFGFFKTQEGGFVGLLRVVARSFDGITTVAKAAMLYAGSQVEAIGARFKNAYNAMVPEFLGGGGPEIAVNAISFGDAMAQSRSNYFEGLMNGYVSRLSVAKEEKAAAANIGTLGSVAGTAATNLGKLGEETKKAKKGSSDKLNPSLSSQTGRMHMVFTAFKNAGFSDEQARQLTAQVGRENEYNSKYLFGTHTDANNGLTNIGMISWQGGRGTKLRQEMQQQGLIKNGKMVQSQEALDYQAKYLAREMANERIYERTRRDFMQNPNPTYEKGMGALNDNFIRWDSAGKKINARPHHEKQRRFYDQISNSTKNMVQEVQEDVKTQEELLKAQQELILKYSDHTTRQLAALAAEKKAVNDAFGENSEDGRKLNEIIETRYRLAGELRQREQLLEMQGYQMSSQDRMALEHEIHDLKIQLSDEYGVADKEIYRKATAQKYQHDLEMFKRLQQQKIQELEKPIKAALGEQEHIAIARMNQKTMRPDDYRRWELSQEMAGSKRAADDTYSSQFREIFKQNDSGQYEIESQEERLRLWEEAYRLHKETIANIDAEYGEKSKTLENELLSAKLGAYGSAAGALAGLFKDMSGEQSRAYRAMFAVSKAFAIADTGIKMGNAIAQAWADPSAVTTWQKMANVAKVTIQQGHLVSMINAINPKGFKTGGYTGNGGINDVAGVVHGKEYVLNARATKRIGTGTLDKLNNGGDIGGGVNVIINNYSSEKATAQQMPNGDVLVTIGKMIDDKVDAKVNQRFIQARRQGGELYGR